MVNVVCGKCGKSDRGKCEWVAWETQASQIVGRLSWGPSKCVPPYSELCHPILLCTTKNSLICSAWAPRFQRSRPGSLQIHESKKHCLTPRPGFLVWVDGTQLTRDWNRSPCVEFLVWAKTQPQHVLEGGKRVQPSTLKRTFAPDKSIDYFRPFSQTQKLACLATDGRSRK